MGDEKQPGQLSRWEIERRLALQKAILNQRMQQRPSLSQYQPKSGDQERINHLRSIYQLEENKPLNRAASSKVAANTMSNIVEPMFDIEMGLGAGRLVGAGAKALGKHLVENTALKNTYKVNPWAERLNNVNKSYRVAGLDAGEDFLNKGILRSNPNIEKTDFSKGIIGTRTTGFPSFQKGYADVRYLPEEGGVVFETNLPTYKRGEINPVTGNTIRGRHYAHRVIDPSTGKTMTEIPSEYIKMFDGKPHWLKGYKEIPKPITQKDVWWDGNKYVNEPPHTEEITRGHIDWADAVNRKNNPYFDARGYENQYDNIGYQEPATGALVPRLRGSHPQARIDDMLKKLPPEDSFNFVNYGEKGIPGQGYAVDPKFLEEDKLDAGKMVSKWFNENKVDNKHRVGLFLNLPKNAQGGNIDQPPIKKYTSPIVDKTYVKSLAPIPTKMDEVRKQRSIDERNTKKFLNDYYSWAVDSVPFYHDLSKIDSSLVKDQYRLHNEKDIKRLDDEIFNHKLDTFEESKKFDTVFALKGHTNLVSSPTLRKRTDDQLSKEYNNYRRKILADLNKPDTVVYHSGPVRGQEGLMGQHNPERNITDVSDQERLYTLIHERAHKADMSRRYDGIMNQTLDSSPGFNPDLKDNSRISQKGFDYLSDWTERQARHRATQYWLQNNKQGYNFKKPISEDDYDYIIKNQDKLPSDITSLLKLYGNKWNFVENINKFAKGGMITDPRGQWAHPGKNTRIPGSNITMQGVPYPVLGIGSNGQQQMMYPGQEYDFGSASHVDEYPMMQAGGVAPIYTNNPNDPRWKAYQDSLTAYNRDIMFDKEFVNLVKNAKSNDDIKRGRIALQEKYPLNQIKPSWNYKNIFDAPVLFSRKDINYTVRDGMGFKKPVQPIIYKRNTQNQLTPVTVNSKQEPRWKAYRDSLEAYNSYRDLTMKLNSKNKSGIDDLYKQNAKHWKIRTGETSSDLQNPNEPDMGGIAVLRYKKPTQPVIYQPWQHLTGQTIPTPNQEFPIGSTPSYLKGNASLQPYTEGNYKATSRAGSYDQDVRQFNNRGQFEDYLQALREAGINPETVTREYNSGEILTNRKMNGGGQIKQSNPYTKRDLYNYLFPKEEESKVVEPTAPSIEEVGNDEQQQNIDDGSLALAMSMGMNLTSSMENKKVNPYAEETKNDILSNMRGVRDLGIWGDSFHQTRKSDHNTGDAWDAGIDAPEIGESLVGKLKREAKERNIKYIIYNGKIWNPSISDEWRPYDGPDKHTDHAHISYNR